MAQQFFEPIRLTVECNVLHLAHVFENSHKLVNVINWRRSIEPDHIETLGVLRVSFFLLLSAERLQVTDEVTFLLLDQERQFIAALSRLYFGQSGVEIVAEVVDLLGALPRLVIGQDLWAFDQNDLVFILTIGQPSDKFIYQFILLFRTDLGQATFLNIVYVAVVLVKRLNKAADVEVVLQVLPDLGAQECLRVP